jgi:hypothetical protein
MNAYLKVEVYPGMFSTERIVKFEDLKDGPRSLIVDSARLRGDKLPVVVMYREPGSVVARLPNCENLGSSIVTVASTAICEFSVN